MQPGTYEYAFQCSLPTTLPTSFEGEFGFIRYTATVYLDRVMWPDQIFEEPITIINSSKTFHPGVRKILLPAVE